MSRRALLLARDPGGTNTIIPLVPLLQQRGYEVALFGKDTALRKYEQAGLQATDLTAAVSEITLEALAELLQQAQADVVITGTSSEDRTENLLWQAADTFDIPSLAIIDHWINYGIRFSPYGVSRIAEYRQNPTHLPLPSRILVMDEESRQALISELHLSGSEPARVVITGQPYFDEILRYQTQQSPQSLQQARRERYGAKPGDIIIGFVSEPITQAYPASHPDTAYWGYTEKTILSALLETLNALRDDWRFRQPESRLIVVLRPHPTEPIEAYRDLAAQWSDPVIRLTVDAASKPWDFILAMDLLCGMSSMMLMESAMMKKPFLSIQIGLRQEDPFVLSRRDPQATIRDAATLRHSLSGFLSGNPDCLPAAGSIQVIPNAAENVVNLIDQLIGNQTTEQFVEHSASCPSQPAAN